ncbi:hypothetical protein EMPG_15992 [Blastomyces silverae]|uniref:C6 finger domain transcription factor nscR n=1 Tax=Blastomyces silverae TaxID=2060906 RepID=A0A0H1BAT6_9EURO|nr:hypothetical protein EMPG_15992 [Blastomyces silverae]
MSSRPLKPKACIPCRTRKVKCNRQSPCANCVSWSLECVFPSPIRTCTRPRRKPTSELKENHRVSISTQPTRNEFGQQSDLCIQGSERSAGAEAMASKLFTSNQSASCLVAGSAPTVASAMSMPFNHTIRLNSGLYRTENDFLFPCHPSPFSSSAVELAFLHPSSHQIDICWQAYLNNVDQIVKVLHAPNSEEILQKAKKGNTSLANRHYALVFTIYLSAILSVPHADVESCFNAPKTEVLRAYRAAAELALARANFLRTENIDTLQAFVLFLSISIFMDETKFAWALSGLAGRLVSSMSTELSPFAKEIHRRLWWQLWYLDRRAAEDHGEIPGSCEAITNPELPPNINDSDIDPNMVEAPHRRNGWTEMSFYLIRLEIARTSSKLDTAVSQPQKKVIITECWANIRSSYLAHCDDRQPVPWLAKHVAHVLNTEMWFKFYGQECFAASPSARARTIRDQLFLLAMDIVDTPRRIERDPHAKTWKWLLKGYLQFLPLGFLLTELCYRTSRGEVVDHAWKVVEDAFSRWTDADRNSKNGEILCRLMDRAKVAKGQTILWPSTMDTSLQTGYRPSQRNDMTATAIGPSHNESTSFIDNLPLLHVNYLGYEMPSSSSTDLIPLDIEGYPKIHPAGQHEP